MCAAELLATISIAVFVFYILAAIGLAIYIVLPHLRPHARAQPQPQLLLAEPNCAMDIAVLLGALF